jgi:uncharacterized protein (TIGR03066 family)
MKMLRLLVVGVAVCGLTFVAGADEKKADNAKLLVGSWEVTKSFDKGPAVGTTVEFTKESKMKVTHKQDGKEETMDGTYKLDGDKFTFELKMGDQVIKKTITIKKISETEMTTTDDDGKVVELKKKK